MTNYDQTYALRFEIQGQLANCVMPPPDAGMLDSASRTALLDWLVCGAPQN
jgi:hypothetical protein